jgi:uncharacterized protein (DUF3820 family)
MTDETSSLRLRAGADLAEIGRTVMPFGRFSGKPIHQLPAEYLAWFSHHGWPRGRLGELLRMVYQMKVDGADAALDFCRGRARPRRHPDAAA